MTRCGHYPPVKSTGELYIKYRPIVSKLFKVSVCLNQNYYNILPRTIPEMKKKYKKIYPGDADIWNQIKEFMEENNEYGVLIDKQTCRKIGGKYPIDSPHIVK